VYFKDHEYPLSLFNHYCCGMLTIISPAKTMKFSGNLPDLPLSVPIFTGEAAYLVSILKKLSVNDLADLMKINVKLARLNHDRFLAWTDKEPSGGSIPAIMAYKGEVYNGLEAQSLDNDDLIFAQNHLRILSGLYGVLRPLDTILPYRLEMAIRLEMDDVGDLYAYWGEKIGMEISRLIHEQAANVLVNLASQEYTRAIKPGKLNCRIITPVFKEARGDSYQVVFVYAKKARGLMTRYILRNRIDDPEALKMFEDEGYLYNERISTDNEWVFTR
jgi:hypothetical protein